MGSPLEPDGPAPHVFPHVREAIRAWATHRQGVGHAKATPGRVRGKGPAIGDIVKVGQLLLSENGLRLNRGQVKTLVDYAMGAISRSQDTATESLVKRVERNMRAMRIVAKATPRFERRRDSWRDTEGQQHESTYCVESS